MTSVMKNPLVVGSGAIALVGIGVYVYQLLFGLGITGMNNSTSWGAVPHLLHVLRGPVRRRPHRGLVGLYLRH